MTKPSDGSDKTIRDFEAAIGELEAIVKKLEEGGTDLSLEKSLRLYTRRGELRPAPARPGSERARPLTLDAFLTRARARVDEALEKHLPSPPDCPPLVSEAMRYSGFAGAKRLAP